MKQFPPNIEEQKLEQFTQILERGTNSWEKIHYVCPLDILENAVDHMYTQNKKI